MSVYTVILILAVKQRFLHLPTNFVFSYEFFDNAPINVVLCGQLPHHVLYPRIGVVILAEACLDKCFMGLSLRYHFLILLIIGTQVVHRHFIKKVTLILPQLGSIVERALPQRLDYPHYICLVIHPIHALHMQL